MKKVKLIKPFSETQAAAVMIAPSFIGLCVFFLLPFADTIRRSFLDTRGKSFVGAASYISTITNSAFNLAAKNTARFISICIPLLLLISLILAILVRKIGSKSKLYKTSYLLPMAVPVASMVLLWQMLFHEKGLINAVLLSRGHLSINFMGSTAAFWVLVGTYIWKNAGYNMILWLAGLDSISQSLYEAASVDGASAWKSFLYITLPSLAPTAGLVAIMSLLNSFKVFREAYLVAGSYPHDSIYLLQHLFNNWFQNLDISRLCAAAVILCGVLLIVILIMQRLFLGAGQND